MRLFSAEIGLHSNMDRLKQMNQSQLNQLQSSLHSNMDRLKPGNGEEPAVLESVYIPIWID